MQLRKGTWIYLAVVIFAIFPHAQTARAADVLINPTFAFDGGGWTGARTTGTGNGACDGGQPNMGTWTTNALSFSYVWSTVTQTITISAPSTVSFDWSSINRGDASGATARVTLADADQSLNTGLITSPTSGVSRSLGPITTTSDNETVTISIYGKDSVGWAGCYGTQFTVSALDVVSVSPPTTTTTTTTSTTVPETTTTTDPPPTTTTTIPPETTTIPETTTTTVPETTTTTTTTSTTLPPTTTTQVATTTTTEVPTTTTTSEPPVPTVTTSTVPEPLPVTTSTVPKPPVTTVPTSVPLTTTTETLPLPVNTSTTPVSVEIPPTTTTSPAIIPATMAEISALDGDQAAEVFAEVAVDKLTVEEGQAIVEAVQDAPIEVREAFEEEIDIFDGVFDTYVPIGSVVSVGARRVIIAVTALLFVLPVPIPTTASTSASRRKGK